MMDPGSFVEYDMFLEHYCTEFGMEKEKVSIQENTKIVATWKENTKIVERRPKWQNGQDTSRKHLRTKVTPDFHLTYSKNGGNLGSESK